LVKGTIEISETIQYAAERELLEESGVVGTAIDYLGAAQMSEPEQEWHFVLCQTGPLPDAWTHRTADEGGLDFEFFWHPSGRNQTRLGIRFSSRRSLSPSSTSNGDSVPKKTAAAALQHQEACALAE
jgi:ADP-ribose pyrophosphatase YjhB (NUDIX family)